MAGLIHSLHKISIIISTLGNSSTERSLMTKSGKNLSLWVALSRVTTSCASYLTCYSSASNIWSRLTRSPPKHPKAKQISSQTKVHAGCLTPRPTLTLPMILHTRSALATIRKTSIDSFPWCAAQFLSCARRQTILCADGRSCMLRIPLWLRKYLLSIKKTLTTALITTTSTECSASLLYA